MKRALADGFVLDDDPGRVDRAAVHAFISSELLGARVASAR